MRPPSARGLYLDALCAAMGRPVAGGQDGALHGFLALNAAYFLGAWLPPAAHRALVRRLAARLDGLADLVVPDDPAHAAQLAQHVRELAVAFGPTVWLERMVRNTAALVPQEAEDWDAPVAGAARRGDGHALRLAHARRRLWELEHPAPAAAAAPATPAGVLRRVARRALTSGDHAIRVIEAALAEMETSQALQPHLEALFPGIGRRSARSGL